MAEIQVSMPCSPLVRGRGEERFCWGGRGREEGYSIILTKKKMDRRALLGRRGCNAFVCVHERASEREGEVMMHADGVTARLWWSVIAGTLDARCTLV